MSKLVLASLFSIANNYDNRFNFKAKNKYQARKKPSFSRKEKQILETLSGKEKREYIKTLKAKYQ